MKKLEPGMAIFCNSQEEWKDLMIQLRDMGYPIRRAIEYGFAKDNAYVIPVCVKENGISCFKIGFLQRLRKKNFLLVNYSNLEEDETPKVNADKCLCSQALFPKVEDADMEILRELIEKYGEWNLIDATANDMTRLTISLMEYERELACGDPDRCEGLRLLIYEQLADIIVGLTQTLMMYGGESEIQELINKRIKGIEKELHER